MKSAWFRKWRWVPVMLLCAALAACGGGSGGSKGGDAKEADTSKFVTVSYLMLGDKPTNGQLEKVMEKVNAILKERVNAHLELQWIEWADWLTKYNLALASGEPLDLITIGTDWLDTWANAQKGAFLPLDDLLPKYAPVTWSEVPDDHWEQSKYNGKIVLIPEDQYTQWVNHGFFYRGDWAKEFGINEPIRDWQTFGRYLQGIVDHKPDVIPWDVNGTKNEPMMGYIISHTDALELPITTGWFPVIWAKSYEEKYTAYSPVFDDTMIEFAKTMKEWADKGYWRKDVLNYKGDTREELLTGLTGADQHHTQTYSTLRVQMDERQPGSELQMFPFALQRGNNLLEMSITHGGTSIGAHSRNPERALMVYDLLRNDEELYRLFNYGIEGVQYEIKDGKRVRPEGYDETRDSFYSNFWGGRMDKYEIPSDTVYENIGELYAEYDKVKKPYPYGRFVFDKTPIEAELAAMSQVTASQGPAIAYGQVSDPVQAVEKLRSDLKAAGFDKVMAEIQKQLDEFRKMVGD